MCSQHAYERARRRLDAEFLADRLDTWELIDDWLCRLAHEAVIAEPIQPGDRRPRRIVRGISIGLCRVGDKIVVCTAWRRNYGCENARRAVAL